MPPITLDGASLSLDAVESVARDFTTVSVSPAAAEKASASRTVVEKALADGRVIYGVNTGFGKLANVRIPNDQILDLQRNLIRSHAAGVGTPLPEDVVRAAMLLRANVLLRETSGVRPAIAEGLAALLNAGIHPVVPEQGSVGACGDLAPLSHMALALLGEGDVDVRHPVRGRTAPVRQRAAAALQEAGIAPLHLEAKEGISFVNGTQAQTAILALLVTDARRLWRTAHAAAAMSLEALRGTPDPFDERIHLVRPHPGQLASAALLRELLADSEIRESHRENDPRVQDAYSLRCAPQVMGPVYDAIECAARTAEIELNAATDNPLVFGGEVMSGGNFHGQPVAMALDFMTVALTTLAGIAERRVERLLNPDLSQGLPAFLAPNPGVESGFMMVQVTAAALVAESRSLCTAASVQSIPTDANQEDIVPMGMAAAYKARRVLENTRRVVAAELLCAAQGIDLLRPLRAGRGVERVYERVRRVVHSLTGDRPIHPDLEALTELIAKETLP